MLIHAQERGIGRYACTITRETLPEEALSLLKAAAFPSSKAIFGYSSHSLLRVLWAALFLRKKVSVVNSSRLCNQARQVCEQDGKVLEIFWIACPWGCSGKFLLSSTNLGIQLKNWSSRKTSGQSDPPLLIMLLEHQQRQHRVARNTWLSGQERTGMHFQGAAANKVCLRVLTRPQPKVLTNKAGGVVCLALVVCLK